MDAAGQAPVSYRWRHGGEDLVDGLGVRGSNSPILVIKPVEAGDAGTYERLVTDACPELASVTSASATRRARSERRTEAARANAARGHPAPGRSFVRRTPAHSALVLGGYELDEHLRLLSHDLELVMVLPHRVTLVSGRDDELRPGTEFAGCIERRRITAVDARSIAAFGAWPWRAEMREGEDAFLRRPHEPARFTFPSRTHRTQKRTVTRSPDAWISTVSRRPSDVSS